MATLGRPSISERACRILLIHDTFLTIYYTKSDVLTHIGNSTGLREEKWGKQACSRSYIFVFLIVNTIHSLYNEILSDLVRSGTLKSAFSFCIWSYREALLSSLMNEALLLWTGSCFWCIQDGPMQYWRQAEESAQDPIHFETALVWYDPKFRTEIIRHTPQACATSIRSLVKYDHWQAQRPPARHTNYSVVSLQTLSEVVFIWKENKNVGLCIEQS